ncbi:MAG: shikimate kinase [Bacteroidota bacterium]
MFKPLCLVGLMGSGKTTLASMLGSILKVQVVDTDRWIEQLEHRTVHEIVLQDGWDYFRWKEIEFCNKFEFSGPCIISTGGGFPTAVEPFNWIMENACGVYLKVSPEIALQRSSLEHDSNSTIRPLLSALSQEERLLTMQRLYEERKMIYEKFPYTVNAENSVETVLQELIKIASEA